MLQFPQPHIIVYETKELRLSILGGIDIHHFDRFRVTLKVEVIHRKFPDYLQQPDIANLAIRQNLDLYNDTQVEKLIRKVCERMEMGSIGLTQALAELVELLEAYRNEQYQQQQHTTVLQMPILSDKDREQALAFLKEPNLMERTDEALGNSGIVGEEINRLLMYIIFTSRKRATPPHIISLGGSGIGKTHLQEKVGALIPQEDKIEITSLTGNALYYFDQLALIHKLLLIEDLDGAQQALFPIRELQSKKRITKTISYKDTKGNTRTMQLVVEGPVCVAGCTTKEQLYEDNANRSFLIHLDESVTQDEAIMDYQRRQSAGQIDKVKEWNTIILMQNCQRLLQPITVKNPYAMQLKIPEEVLKTRRTNRHYLDFIEAVTFYHQFQREQHVEPDSGEVYINTTIEDIAAANTLMKEVLLRKADLISGAARAYLERLKDWIGEQNQLTFTNREIQTSFRIPHSTVKRYHKELTEAGAIQIASVKHRNYTYQLTDAESYKKRQQEITGVLDNILEQLQQVPKTRLKRIKTAQ